MVEIEKYAKENRPVTRKRKWPRRFLIIGPVLLFIVLLYRLLVYATYLEVNDVIVSDKDGTTTIPVKTDAVFMSLHIYGDEWCTIKQSGKNVIVEFKENNEAKDREVSFAVLTGVIDDLCYFRQVVTITQAGKGATYIKAVPDTIELKVKNNKDKYTSTVIDTDGDNWEIVTCPDWVLSKIDGDELKLAAKNDAVINREGIIVLKSYNEYANICVTQKMKPKYTTEQKKPKNYDYPKPKPKLEPKPAPKPLPVYRVQHYYVSDASLFSRIMIIDEEVDGDAAYDLWKKYKQEGWRPLVRSEMLFMLEKHLGVLPLPEHGYWIQYQNTEYLQGVSRATNGDADPTPNENRIAFVK